MITMNLRQPMDRCDLLSASARHLFTLEVRPFAFRPSVFHLSSTLYVQSFVFII